MSVPLWVVLVLAIWLVVAIIAHRDYRNGGWASGLGALLAFLLGVIATLIVVILRDKTEAL